MSSGRDRSGTVFMRGNAGSTERDGDHRARSPRRALFRYGCEIQETAKEGFKQRGGRIAA